MKTVLIFYFRNYPFKFVFYIILMFSFSILVPLAFSGICVDSSNFKGKGFTIPFFGVTISTSIMRSLTFKQPCPPGEPCHVYVTLPQQASTGLFVNFHIGRDSCPENYCQPGVYYWKDKYTDEAMSLKRPDDAELVVGTRIDYNAPEGEAER